MTDQTAAQQAEAQQQSVDAARSRGVMSDKEVLDLVLANRAESETWQRASGYIDEWKTWNDQYRNVAKAKPRAWMSNKYVPYTYSKVETAVANLSQIFFSINPPFEVRPREAGDATQAKIMQKLLSHQFAESRMYEELTQFLRALCIYGTAVGKIYWKWERRDQMKWQPVISPPLLNLWGVQAGGGEITGYQPEAETETYGYPCFTLRNINDVFPDPRAIGIQDSWVIDRSRRTVAHLRWLKQSFPDEFSDDIMRISGDKQNDRPDQTTQNITAAIGRQLNPATTRPDGMGPVEILEWWGPAVNMDGDVVPSLFTVACSSDGNFLIRDSRKSQTGRSPYFHGKNPFVKGVYVPAINEFYGIGLCEVLEDTQNGINELVNQRADNIRFILNKPIMYKKGVGVDIHKAAFAPGALIGMDEDVTTAMRILDVPEVTQSAFIHVSDHERWGEEATAVTRLILGMPSGASQTATGTAIQQQNAGSRFVTIAKLIEQQVFAEIIQQYYQLDYQYITDEQVVRIVGQKGGEFVRVSPDEIRRDYDFVPAGVFNIENKSQLALRLMQFGQVAKGSPWFKEQEWMKKVYAAMEVGDFPEELLRTEEEMAEHMAHQAQVQALQAMMMQGLQPGPGAPQGSETAGLTPNDGQISGDTTPGTPGMPPTNASVAPGDRV